MFTGIVRDLGRVTSFDGGRLIVDTEIGASLGDSVSINGACLTVVANDDGLAFDVVSETLARTTLGGLSAGAVVNLQRAPRGDSRARGPRGGAARRALRAGTHRCGGARPECRRAGLDRRAVRGAA